MYNAPNVINLFGVESYHDKFPEISLMAEISCFVRMIRYDVIIPVRKKVEDKFNIFERTIIKLAELHITSPVQAANYLCMPVELATFIFSRLTQLGILNSDGSLSENGIKYLNLQDSEESAVEYYPAVILESESTGEFLPLVLSADEINYEEACFNGKTLTMTTGSAGKRISITAEIIKPDEKSSAMNRPNWISQRNLRKIIDKYNNILVRMNQQTISYYRDRMIECSPSGLVYVHCKAAVQSGNVENIICSEGILVSNGIIGRSVNNCSAFKKELIDSVAVTEKDDEASRPQTSRYSKITETYKDMREVIHDTNTPDEVSLNTSNITDNLYKLYSMLEHTFNYYLKGNPYSSGIVSMFRSQNKADNCEVLKGYLERMGADLSRVSFLNILSVNKEELNRYLNDTDTPNLRVVVPLAIAQANENPESTIRDMILKYPRFLSQFDVLSKYAASSRHGGNQKSPMDEKKYSQLYKSLLDIIQIILPDIELENKANKSINRSQITGKKASAISFCAKDLGAELYYSLDKTIQEELLKTSSDKSSKELPKPSGIIMSFCKIIERLLLGQLQNVPQPLKGCKADALLKIRQMTGKECLEGLASVSENNVENAALGLNSTLGGLTLVYILNEDTDKIRNFLGKEYHIFIGELTTKRKHGNNIGLCLNPDEINALRQRLYELIVFLEGNYE